VSNRFYTGIGQPANEVLAVGTAQEESTPPGYEAAGRLVASWDQNGNATTYVNDPVGRQISTTNANSGVEKTYYDLDGEVVRTIDVVTVTYDAIGKLATQGDVLGPTTTYVADALGSTGATGKSPSEAEASGLDLLLSTPAGS
jgi:YD repeat-containing protein